MNEYFRKHLKLHPSVTAQDMIKFAYQAAFGAEHLVRDRDLALRRLREEADAVPAEDIPLYEEISPLYCRVNIAAWKYAGRSVEELCDFFIASAKPSGASDEDFLSVLNSCIGEAEVSAAEFRKEEWLNTVEDCLSGGIRPVHHSERYRAAENPHYRLVRTELLT